MKETKNSGLSFLYKNRKMFAMALLLGGVVGGGISFFIPKKYLSTAIIYPYNSHTRENLVVNPQFGFEVETEQLMQLLESKSMFYRTVEKFKLYDYYGVDTTQNTWHSELSMKYISDVNFYRSKYLSVVINVTMEDPNLAADVANFQVEEVDRYRDAIFRDNRERELAIAELEYTNSGKQLAALKDSIYDLVENKALLYNFVENLDNENFDPSAFVTSPKLEVLVEEYVFELGRNREFRTTFNEMKEALLSPLPSVYSIDTAVPSYKKVSPSFILNILIGALLVFLLTLTFKMVGDKWHSLRTESK
ncbi:MAG: hypothetical protein A3D92_11325 [Bacteroidetes bacterium RIFCSPHIGHO2_02_FULL_44_7]|nr:MAG: hypothetical protein A3D92_11325 [Bacteroidetes bacterium RIFCSPHIGHO2_02_FULL_44_7]